MIDVAQHKLQVWEVDAPKVSRKLQLSFSLQLQPRAQRQACAGVGRGRGWQSSLAGGSAAVPWVVHSKQRTLGWEILEAWSLHCQATLLTTLANLALFSWLEQWSSFTDLNDIFYCQILLFQHIRKGKNLCMIRLILTCVACRCGNGLFHIFS